MNLFDILKYQNTDLSSAEELGKLPRNLLILYWKNVNGTTGGASLPKHEFMCRMLAKTHIMRMPSYRQRCFNEALKEYNP